MKKALTIAGSDPTGGAGLQADLRVFKSLGVHGLSVPTAITVQNTSGVRHASGVDEGLLEMQLDCLLDDMTPDAVKTGMLYKKRAVEVVAGAVKGRRLNNLVIDPVSISSSGAVLLEEGAMDVIRERLFPLAKVITPNIYEASVFTGINVEDEADMERAARVLKEMGPEVVIITGGHLKDLTVDLYYDGMDFKRLSGEKIPGEYHGTGCAFSAAVSAFLALGKDTQEAFGRARNFIEVAIRRAYHPGKGMGILYL